eukprot:10224000-Alexandrium_andersonii.AAC.1
MAAIRASRLPAEIDPDQPARRSQVWSDSSECGACSIATGQVVSRLVRPQAEAALASDCSAGQAVSVVWAPAVPAHWPGPGPDHAPWARRRRALGPRAM